MSEVETILGRTEGAIDSTVGSPSPVLPVDARSRILGNKIPAFKRYTESQPVPMLSEDELREYYANCSPYLYVLKGQPWQLFGTLTFPNPLPTERGRLGLFIKYVRGMDSRKLGSFPAIVWCLRHERGGRFDREHLHFLMFDRSQPTLDVASIKQIGDLWGELVHGTAKVVGYDSTQDAVRYVLKKERASAIAEASRDSPVFGPRDCEVEFSNSLKELLGIER